MKIVFLDIDGVICTWASMRGDDERERTGRAYFEGHFFPGLARDCIERVNQITEDTGAVVVISSAWRSGNDERFERLKRYLAHNGLKAEVIGRTPYVYEDHPDYKHGRHADRGVEIQVWIDAYEGEVEACVILDDESDMAHLKGWLVQVQFGMNGGIQQHHVDAALAKLSHPGPPVTERIS